MSRNTVSVNRAPVLTLWASVVAQRFGHDEDSALTLGQAVAALNARSKGRRLGIYGPPKEKGDSQRPAEPTRVEVCGRSVPVRETKRGVRAVLGGKAIFPNTVRKYLGGAFGEELGPVRAALEALAESREPAELEREAYALYEQFRPAVPSGPSGWGAKGELDLDLIRRLGRRVPAR